MPVPCCFRSSIIALDSSNRLRNRSVIHGRPIRYVTRLRSFCENGFMHSRLGSENQDDLDRLAHDPAMRMAARDRPGEEVLAERLASQPTQSRLIDWLALFLSEIVRRFDTRNFSIGLIVICPVSGRGARPHRRDAGHDRHGQLFRSWFTASSTAPFTTVHYHDTVMYHPLVASFWVHGDYDSTSRRASPGKRLHPRHAPTTRTSSHRSGAASVHVRTCDRACSSDGAGF